MASFSAGTTFTDGVANDVTAAKLAALVNAATPTSGFIQDRTAETSIASNDTLLVGDASDSNNLKRMTVANFAGTLPTATITSGTITTLNSTTGTITTGVIPTLTSTTLITTGTGTAAAPAIVPTGDTNTGIFFPAADTIAFGEGGVESMRIDSSGNVGIGTVSPTAQVTIGKVVDSATIPNTPANHSISLYPPTTTDYYGGGIGWSTGVNTAANICAVDDGGSGALGLVLSTGNTATLTERLRIDSSGNVGIGTTSPTIIASSSKILDIVGVLSGAVRFERTSSTNPTYGYVGATNGAVELNAQSSSSIVLSTNGTNRLSINSSGDVTITDLAGTGSRAVNASATGLLSAASDASLKEEVIGAHIAGLAEILQIHPKMYRWKDDIANRGNEAAVELGFIANDVAPIIPSAAPLGNDGLYGFYDRSITAALVKAVQELKAENDSLKSRIESLEAK